MSLIITTYVREGIVLSSDSRLSVDNASKGINSITQTDSHHKTFVTNNGVGISTCGTAGIKSVPLSGFIESFISEDLGDSDDKVEEVVDKLILYFKDLDSTLNTTFHVAGYDEEEVEIQSIDARKNNDKDSKKIKKIKIQKVFFVNIKNNIKRDVIKNKGAQNTLYHGHATVMDKLLNTVNVNVVGKAPVALPFNGIAYNFFTLQDAIDFNRYAIKTTIDTMRFELVYKTVGGPIDVLVIKPNEVKWVSKKELT